MTAPVRSLLNAVPLPTVDFLHPDPLGDDALFAEPEHFQRIYDVRSESPVTRYAGTLPPNWPDILGHIVGDGDVGFVVTTLFGEQESYAVLRLCDWESIERGRARK